jgi:Domain of unknown function (DUF2382)
LTALVLALFTPLYDKFDDNIMNQPLKSLPSQTNSAFNNLSKAIQKNTEILAQESINLLEERLIVENKICKKGEVVVRKVVETRIIEVPVRNEKLIIEQVYPEYKQLAEINLEIEENTQTSTIKSVSHLNRKSSISSNFGSIHSAMQYLETISLKDQYKKVQIEITIQF